MQLTIGPPLLFAIGVRILLNLLDTTRSPSIPDFFLIGIWQGVLIHYSLRQLSWLVYPVAFGITAKLLYDYVEKADPSRCACTLFGIAVGVLLTDLLVQVLENGRYDERDPPPTPQPSRTPYEPPRRTRLVSFDRSAYNGERRRDKERRRRTPSPERARARTLAASPAPTAHTAAPTSYTIDSVPSSIDPDNKLTPTEREIAVLRARASLADSERRRYKEERKWALSQGNHARADQLAFHVKRYTTLMESFHKEADNKVVEGALVGCNGRECADLWACCSCSGSS